MTDLWVSKHDRGSGVSSQDEGIVNFLGCLDHPSKLPKYLPTADVEECGYIFISHAYFGQDFY